MKILWLSSANTLFNEKGDRAYNGKGWIASLQNAVCEFAPDLELGVAFLSAEESGAVRQNGITYYKIKKRSPKGVRKLWNNWTGGKIENYDSAIRHIADDFRPDIVHVFGCESKLATAVLSIKDIPVTVHIQGILNEYINYFYPPDTCARDMVTRKNFFNEVILKNGYIHLFEDYKLRAEQEKACLNGLRYAMGRTEWDKNIVRAYSSAEYFHVDEVLRPAFYEYAGACLGRTAAAGKRIRLATTISPAPYKGLDLILRTADALVNSGLEPVWDVSGISEDSGIVRIFEKKTGIRAKDCGIRFKGVLNEYEIVKILSEADIYVHPSYIENSPNSICEAQLLGLPVVATDAGGTSSLVRNGISGKIVPAGDHCAAAEAIMSFLADSGSMHDAAKAASEDAALRHDRRKIVSDLMSAYIRIAAPGDESSQAKICDA